MCSQRLAESVLLIFIYVFIDMLCSHRARRWVGLIRYWLYIYLKEVLPFLNLEEFFLNVDVNMNLINVTVLWGIGYFLRSKYLLYLHCIKLLFILHNESMFVPRYSISPNLIQINRNIEGLHCAYQQTHWLCEFVLFWTPFSVHAQSEL